MSWQDAALMTAGVVGSGVALVHGILVQRLMVKPLGELWRGDKRISGPIRRLIPALLHLSTISWFLGGLALVAAGAWLNGEARLATAWFVGALYLFGAVVNLWATRGRHPGWMLMALALALIVAGAREQPTSAEDRTHFASSEGRLPQHAPIDGLADPPAPPPPSPSLPGLLPLTSAQIAGELGSGASCTLSDGGPPLMVAMVGDAIVNDRGRIVHLEHEATGWNGLNEGGRFSAGDIAVEVDPGAVVARQEEVVERDASVSIARGGRGFAVSHGPRWSCGS